MAPKFKPGDKARYVGPAERGATAADIGREVTIVGIGHVEPFGGNDSEFYFLHTQLCYPGEVIYQIDWDSEQTGFCPERYLEKSLPKHQLPRWLGLPEKEKALETE